MGTAANSPSSIAAMLSLPPRVNPVVVGVLIVGLLSLFVPTYVTLSEEVWNNDAHGHGPLILGVSLWLLWHDRLRILDGEPRPDLLSGFALLALGLLVHVAGHSQGINMFTTLAQPIVFGACLLLLHGWQALRRAWFPLFFMLFMVPLPEVAVQAITMPLKQAVSWATEWLLYVAGYPIARSGVTLSIGPYQLLVADACSGMNSLLTLESLGLLYMRLMNYQSRWRNTLLAIAIVPTSFIANVTRVIILVLVTYHQGDEVGQGFVHSFSGLVLFTVSLVSIYFIDRVLGLWFKAPQGAQP
ncbi:MAG: exosortase B [Proteobacteria bacterium]|nr:exosortase B [Pseudomonadota bacterium]